jgi:hypothetical protein
LEWNLAMVWEHQNVPSLITHFQLPTDTRCLFLQMNKSLRAVARFRNNSYVENIGIAAGRKVVKELSDDVDRGGNHISVLDVGGAGLQFTIKEGVTFQNEAISYHHLRKA